MTNNKAITIESIKTIYKNRFGISRGKKAPASFEVQSEGVLVKTNEDKFMFLPFEMFTV